MTDEEISAKYEVDGLIRGKTVRDIAAELADAIAAADAAGTAVDWRCNKCDSPSNGISHDTISAQQGGLQHDVVIVEPCKHRILVLP